MKTKLITTALLLITTSLPLAAGVVSVPTPPVAGLLAASTSSEQITTTGFGSTASPGDPALPAKEIRIILPPDADPDSVSVSIAGAKPVMLGGKRDVAPAPPLAISTGNGVELDWGRGKRIQNGRNLATYERDAFFPASHVELVNVGNLRKWRIATVRYHPYLYNPVSRRMQFAAGGQIQVSYSVGAQTAEAVSADNIMSDQVAALAANYTEAQDWYASDASVQATNGYAIITTSAIVQGSAKLQSFISHKTNRGFTVTVATEAQWGGGTGDGAANNIRAWLKSNYLSKSIKYVLLIGNPHPTTGTVPMKMLWPRYESTTYREAPSDYFYADLTGNWDRNGNGYSGDLGDFGTGGTDVYPEVIVGRIPFYGSFTELDSILQKTIDYESGGIGGSWVRNALVCMKPSDANTPGYQLGEAIKRDAVSPAGFTTSRVYEQNYGLSPVPNYIPCNYDTCLAAANQHMGFWFWWTHGNETVADQILTTDRTANLDDRYPSFTFQCSCMNGTPERSDNLGYALLKRGAIATDSASRVSWYYQGQVDYTDTDSNAGMTYIYAIKLVRDHMACGDAHYAMMLAVPQQIWMNHLVFNIYGDPSVSYAAGPLVSHMPLQDTDDTVHSYQVTADVTSNGPLAAGNPVVKWNANGGSTFSSVAMSLVSGVTYSGQIPAQPLGATVYYYVNAQDSQGRIGTSPTSAPSAVHSFKIHSDLQPPAISHTPLTDTGITSGPYIVQATVTDDCGVKSVSLRYSVNGAAEIQLPMLPKGSNLYEAIIPGPMQQGAIINYYILATDTSLAIKTARCPASSYHTFSIKTSRVAIYNCTTVPSYFTGSNSNIYANVLDALAADLKQRFSATVITTLTAADLADKDSLVLPDNAVALADLNTVRNWFTSGKTIVAIDSAANYAAYSGLLWPAAAGTGGYAIYWDQGACVDDQKIALQDAITTGYSLGQIIGSRGYGVEFLLSSLPSDATVLSISNTNPARVYAVYRDVPGAGRIVALGPFRPLETEQYSMLCEALAVPGSAPRSIQMTLPSGGESFRVGQTVTIRYSTSGGWSLSDTIKLEYTTGLDSTWHAIPGASSLAYSAGSYAWSTAGLPASLHYRVRATHIGGTVSDESAGEFAIAPVVTIAAAKGRADGSTVKIEQVVVTSAAPDAIYVEDQLRIAGIRITTTQALAIGDIVTLTGTLSTVSGERVFSAHYAEVFVGAASDVTPFAMTTRALGGGASGLQQAITEYRRVPGVQSAPPQALPACGASNIGILVRVAGKVTGTGLDYFYIDDGSKCNDGSGLIGVRIISGSATKPAIGTRVIVTGVSSTYFDRGATWRAIVLPVESYVQMQ